jgi:MFS family permease
MSESPARTLIARRALRAASLGFFVDMFEVYLPVAVLAPALGYFTPPHLSSSGQATLFYTVFSISLIGRPIGSVIFGHFGDRLGRRRTTLISVAGFGIATLLIAALPGYATWGSGAIVVLLLLRLIDGVFVGGEYTAANPMAMEYAPPHKRGLYGSCIHAGYPIALVCISLLAAYMLRVAPAGDAHSPYALWGWRVPFIVGGLLASWLFVYYYFFVPESDLWRESRKSAAPLRDLAAGPDLRRVAQLFVVVSGAWLTLNSTIGVLPALINTILGDPTRDVNTGILIGAAVSIAVYPTIGVVSQRIGRRPTIVALGLLSIVPGSLLYYTLVAGAYRSSPSLIALVAIIVVFSIAVWAAQTPYLAESFRTGIRSSGYGISYSLAAVLPGLYSLYMLGLAKLMPYQFTPVVLLALGGLLISVGALAGPETRDVDLTRGSVALAQQ